MAKQFSHGSAQDMLNAFRNALGQGAQVESCDDVFAEDYEGVSMNDASSKYIEELIDYCNNELTAEDVFDGITWEEHDDALELTCVDGSRILNYSIPKSDLSADDIESDGDYICNTVRSDLNGDYYDDEYLDDEF